jgi:hypothetical protein
MSQSIPKQQFLAAGRRSLAMIAAWTYLIFDGGAGTRLTDNLTTYMPRTIPLTPRLGGSAVMVGGASPSASAVR